MSTAIRPAVPADLPFLHACVVALAAEEELPERVDATEDDLAAALFADRPLVEAAVAEAEGSPVGCALFGLRYSTVAGRPTLHLEDLYVTPAGRGRGVGTDLLRHLAREAHARDCARFEWWVLTTNTGARRLYARVGGRELDEIRVVRLAGDALAAFAVDARLS